MHVFPTYGTRTAVRERTVVFDGVGLVLRSSLDLRNRGSNDLAPRSPDDHIYGCALVSDLSVRGCHLNRPGEPAGPFIQLDLSYIYTSWNYSSVDAVVRRQWIILTCFSLGVHI